MALLTGNWSFNGAGSAGNFSITNVGDQGDVQGTLDSTPFQGYFDANARKLVFLCANPNDGSMQVYTGYVFGSVRVDFEQDILIGTVETFSGSGPEVQVSTDGWYATIGHVIT